MIRDSSTFKMHDSGNQSYSKMIQRTVGSCPGHLSGTLAVFGLYARVRFFTATQTTLAKHKPKEHWSIFISLAATHSHNTVLNLLCLFFCFRCMFGTWASGTCHKPTKP